WSASSMFLSLRAPNSSEWEGARSIRKERSAGKSRKRPLESRTKGGFGQYSQDNVRVEIDSSYIPPSREESPMRIRTILSSVLCLVILSLAAATLADTLVMKDGTRIDGRVVEQTDKYWVKSDSGPAKIVPKTDVAEWKGGSSATPAAPALASPTAGASAVPAAPAGASLGFAETKSKADRAEAPLVAIGLWQNFIDSNTTSPD